MTSSHSFDGKRVQLDALEQFFVTHYVDVVGLVCRRYRCQRADGEDVVMDAFIRLQQQVERGNVHDGNVKGYWVKAAINVYLDRQRGPGIVGFDVLEMERWLTERDEGDGDVLAGSKAAVLEDARRRRRWEAVCAVLEQMRPRCREVLEGFYLFNMRLKDIADELGASANSVKATRYSCFKRFKGLVEDFLNK